VNGGGGDMKGIHESLARKGSPVHKAASQVPNFVGDRQMGMFVKADSRRSAAEGSPPPASATTASETKRSYLALAAHHA
jgi:hypothetical protein